MWNHEQIIAVRSPVEGAPVIRKISQLASYFTIISPAVLLIACNRSSGGSSKGGERLARSLCLLLHVSQKACSKCSVKVFCFGAHAMSVHPVHEQNGSCR